MALLTKNGLPPTARKARTGELTPPGMYFNASAKSFSDFGRTIFTFGEMFPPANLFHRREQYARLQGGKNPKQDGFESCAKRAHHDGELPGVRSKSFANGRFLP